MTSFSSTEWTFIGISIGWTAFTWKYTFWAYIYQGATNIEKGACATGMTISSINDTIPNSYVIGPGLDGYLKSFYITNTIHDVFSFSQFKNTFGQQRFNCFQNSFNEEPFYINPGWGNGYVLPSETSEGCDDFNTINSDGWNNNWLIQPGFKCTNTGVAGISSCTPTWRNGNLAYLTI